MAFPTASCLYSANFLYPLKTPDGTNGMKIGTNALKAALYGSGMGQDPKSQSSLGYNATGELSGGGYSAGGSTLGTVTFTVAASTGLLTLTAADTTYATLTASGIKGCVIYDNVATAPVTKPAIIAVTFASDGSCSGGTFTIAWASGTVFTITP